MEQVINTIIEAERKAQLIVDEARKQKDELPSCVECDTKALHDRYLAKEKARLQKVYEAENVNYNEQIAILESKKETQIKQLDDLFVQNCDKWVLELFNRILGR